MSDRSGVLASLVTLREPLDRLRSQLSAIPWDSDQPIVVLTQRDAASVLKRFVDNHLSGCELEEWANLIEAREDIGYDAEAESLLRQFIHEIANPDLEGQLTVARAMDWLRNVAK